MSSYSEWVLQNQEHIKKCNREYTLKSSKRQTTAFDWEKFHTLDAIYDWFNVIAFRYPAQVMRITVGVSHENYPIRGLKISHGAGLANVFVEGGMHGREWISPAFVTYLANALVSSADDSVRHLAQSYDWYLVPVVNPDGYRYSHEHNRMWRKTRQPYGRKCFGADMNRNWDFMWGAHHRGDMTNPASNTYPGPRPFSEFETRSYAQYLHSLPGGLLLFLTIHSFGQMILFPYGHTSSVPANFAHLMKIAKKAAEAISQRYGTKYAAGPSYSINYPSGGTSRDYVYDVLKVPLCFTYELRPQGKCDRCPTGFDLPVEEIVPVCEETLDSICALVRAAEQLGYPNVIATDSL